MFKIVSRRRYHNLVDELRTKNYRLKMASETVRDFISAFVEKGITVYDLYGQFDMPEKMVQRLASKEYNDGLSCHKETNDYIIKEHEESIKKQEEEIKKLIRENNDLHEYIRNVIR